MVSLITNFLTFLANVGLYDVVLPFIVLYCLGIWLLILRFGKKDRNYKRGIFVLIGILIINGLLNFSFKSSLIAGIFSLAIIGCMIALFIMKKHLDIAQVYLFSIIGFVFAFIIIALTNLVRIISEKAFIIPLIIVILLVLGIIFQRKKNLAN